MRLRDLMQSDLIIIDTLIGAPKPMNFKEVSEATGLGYNTTRTKMNEHIRLGLYVKAGGGRYVKNREFGVMSLFEQIRDHADFIPPVEEPPPPVTSGYLEPLESEQEATYGVVEYGSST